MTETLSFTGADAEMSVSKQWGTDSASTSIVVSGIPSGATIKSVTLDFSITWQNTSPYTCELTYPQSKDCKPSSSSATGNAFSWDITSWGYVTGNGTYTFTWEISESTAQPCWTTAHLPTLIIVYEKPASLLHRAESGVLVSYALHHAEGGSLVEYGLYRAENGALVKY